MKKIILVAFMAVFTSSAFAQLMTSRMTTVKNNHNSKIWFDFGLGGFSGDVNDTGLGVDLGFRWTEKFGESFCWDILKLSAQTDTKSFTKSLNVQLKTGPRYVSPVLFGSQSLYANANIGYGLFTDNTDAHGLAWEIGAGINITPRFSAGIVYNSQHYSMEIYKEEEKKYNVGYIALRLALGL